jgi:hypothetical protein
MIGFRLLSVLMFSVLRGEFPRAGEVTRFEESTATGSAGGTQGLQCKSGRLRGDGHPFALRD